MKAIVYERYGPPDVLELKEVEKPTPKDNEVLIKVHAASVVAGDCEMRGFTFPMWFWLPLRLYAGLFRPKRVRILGQELAGVIESVGKDVKGFKEGDQVFAPTDAGFGAHAEFKCLKAEKAIAKKPANISFAEAAAVPVGGLNSLHYLRLGNLQPGEGVLINGAAGNIGSFAVRLAKVFGAEVTGVDSGGKLDMMRAIGADHVIDYTQEDFTQNGETYDVIFDVIGKAPYSKCVRQLNPGGRYLIANPVVSHMLRAPWTSRTSDKRVIFRFAPYHTEALEFLGELMEAGKLKPFIDKTFPLEQVPEAHRYVEAGQKKGNVVITVAHED